MIQWILYAQVLKQWLKKSVFGYIFTKTNDILAQSVSINSSLHTKVNLQ